MIALNKFKLNDFQFIILALLPLAFIIGPLIVEIIIKIDDLGNHKNFIRTRPHSHEQKKAELEEKLDRPATFEELQQHLRPRDATVWELGEYEELTTACYPQFSGIPVYSYGCPQQHGIPHRLLFADRCFVSV